MSEIMRHAVFAAGGGDIITIVFILIGIVSWILNALKEKSQANERAARPPVRRPQKKRDDSLQNEIDIFIQEVTGKQDDQRPQPSQTPRQPQQPRPVAKVERPPLATRERRPRPVAPQPPTPAPQKTSHTRPGEEISSRKGPGSRDLGADLTRHVEQRMKPHLIREEEKRLGHNVDASVAAHLGISSSPTTSVSTPSPASAMITDVRRMLANPTSAAQAILLNEILSPPRSKRS